VSTHTQDEIGTDFVGYRIETLIGRGGMGVVYRAYDLRLKRTVALKLVAPEFALDARFRARFARESELAMSLEHPNVVPIYDAGDVDGRLYLALRHVRGTDLRALLRAEATLDPQRVLAIVRQVGNALDAAHANGLVHRDVKPSNVLLDEDDYVYLADLGLTRRLEEQGLRAGEDRSLGTPAYLAPEQIDGGPVDGRADVYSLGCLLYECLTGRPPFEATSRLAVAWAHLEDDPPSASEHNPDLPGAIDAVIRKALAKAPEERYRTCAALIADAEAALGLRQPPIFRRRLLLLTAASIFALVFSTVAVALLVRGTRDSALSPASVRPNTLVRIDPVKNRISDVIPVGRQPTASIARGHTVWVYNDGAGTLSQIDSSNHAVRETPLSATPARHSPRVGPVLDADGGGAWLVGSDNDGKGFLTRVLRGTGEKREYRLGVQPRALAVGEGAVWVAGHGSRDDRVLRIDPGRGKATARKRFPASVHIDSLSVGLGAVWLADSSAAILYRIDPRSLKVTRKDDFGEGAGIPVVRFGNVWLPVRDQAATLVLDPRTLDIVSFVCCPERGPSATGYGSTWLADVIGGEVVRFGRSVLTVATIPVLTGSPFWGHPCLSSIAAGAGGVWVTVAAPVRPASQMPLRCPR
jgi:serine/threonine protein kinase